MLFRSIPLKDFSLLTEFSCKFTQNSFSPHRFTISQKQNINDFTADYIPPNTLFLEGLDINPQFKDFAINNLKIDYGAIIYGFANGIFRKIYSVYPENIDPSTSRPIFASNGEAVEFYNDGSLNKCFYKYIQNVSINDWFPTNTANILSSLTGNPGWIRKDVSGKDTVLYVILPHHRYTVQYFTDIIQRIYRPFTKDELSWCY